MRNSWVRPKGLRRRWSVPLTLWTGLIGVKWDAQRRRALHAGDWALWQCPGPRAVALALFWLVARQRRVELDIRSCFLAERYAEWGARRSLEHLACVTNERDKTLVGELPVPDICTCLRSIAQIYDSGVEIASSLRPTSNASTSEPAKRARSSKRRRRHVPLLRMSVARCPTVSIPLHFCTAPDSHIIKSSPNFN